MCAPVRPEPPSPRHASCLNRYDYTQALLDTTTKHQHNDPSKQKRAILAVVVEYVKYPGVRCTVTSVPDGGHMHELTRRTASARVMCNYLNNACRALRRACTAKAGMRACVRIQQRPAGAYACCRHDDIALVGACGTCSGSLNRMFMRGEESAIKWCACE